MRAPELFYTKPRMSFRMSSYFLECFTSVWKLCIPVYAHNLHIVMLDPRSWELRTQKLKSHLVRPQSLNVLPLKPGGGQ